MFFYGNRYFFIFAEKPVILKMKTTIIFLILSLMFPCFSFASDTKTIVEVLNELDEVIEKKHIYDVKKEESIAALKSRLSKGGDERVRYELNDSLFVAYLHYQADSAMYYVNKKVELLSFIDELEYAHEVIINKAEIMGIMGLSANIPFNIVKAFPSFPSSMHFSASTISRSTTVVNMIESR